MLGTRMDTMGGISAVVGVYRDAGLLDRHRVVYLPTHADGSAARKLRVLGVALLRFAALLLLGRIALLHVHTSSRASFWRKSLFFVPAFGLRVPTVLHLHGGEFPVFHDRECGPRRRAFIRWVFERCDRVLVLSAGWRDWVRAMCRNPHVVVLYNPVTMPPAVPFQTRQAAHLLFLGRLGLLKGTYELLEAVAALAPGRPDLRLLLGGDGEVESVRARAAELGIADRVETLGWVRDADKRRHLDQAGIYVLPSHHEGLPMSVLEAMASGLPVVSTTVGGIPEAVRDGVDGFLVAPGDVVGLADRLGRLLSDSALAHRMGQASRARAEGLFSTSAVLPQLERVWGDLLARP